MVTEQTRSVKERLKKNAARYGAQKNPPHTKTAG
jgi:hypothetical protein